MREQKGHLNSVETETVLAACYLSLTGVSPGVLSSLAHCTLHQYGWHIFSQICRWLVIVDNALLQIVFRLSLKRFPYPQP